MGWLSLSMIALLIGFIYYGLNVRSRFHFRKLPGKYEEFLFGSLRTYSKAGRWDFFIKYSKIYKSDTFVSWIGREIRLFTANADLIKKVGQLTTRAQYLTRDPLPQELDDVALHSDIVFARGPQWQDVRRITAPAFYPDTMPYYFNTVSKHIQEIIGYIDGENKATGFINSINMAQYLTTMVIMDTAFGVSLDIKSTEDMEIIQKIQKIGQEVVFKDFKDPYRQLYFFGNFLLPDLQDFLRFLKFPLYKFQRIDMPPALSNFICNTIKEKSTLENILDFQTSVNGIKPTEMANPLQNIQNWKEHIGPGLYTKLITRGLIKGKPVTENQALANIGTMMIAGNETTATNIGLILFNLAKRPDIQGKVIAEIDRFGRNRQITYEDIEDSNVDKNFGYLMACIKENQRMFPVVQIMYRQITNKGFKLEDTEVPVNTIFQIDVRGVHMNINYWKDPSEFIPERFLKGANSQYAQQHPNAFIPFGIGPRSCVGYRLAMMEIIMTLVTLYQNYEFLIPKHYQDVDIEVFMAITLQVKKPLLVVPQRR